MIDQFREEVYHSFAARADAGLDLIDALTSAGHVASPVEQSESPLFRCGFSSIYDFLNEGRLRLPALRGVLDRHQPAAAESIAGYEVYVVDCTADLAPEAATLPDRGQSKQGHYAATEVGHRYSWLVRPLEWGTSWAMPQDVRRVPTERSDSQVAAEQVADLAARNTRPKVVVADSLYGNVLFLSIFLSVQCLYALVRLRSNRVLYEAPPPLAPGEKRKGRPPKHGAKFKLTDPSRAPDRAEEGELLGQRVRLTAWEGLHFYQLPALVGLVLCVQFLKADGTPRFARPLYLFWTGPATVALLDLARVYLWRFAIEHLFRFLKQHLGLSCCNSPDLDHRLRWMWCCALAYCQLVLLRSEVSDQRPAWHPRAVQGRVRPLTPRQVQRQALAVLLKVGTPARAPQPAGKGTGRPQGYRPPSRTRHPVVKKSKKQRQAA